MRSFLSIQRHRWQPGEGSDDWLPVTTLVYTGLRRGELFALRWSSLGFQRNTLRVSGTVALTVRHGQTVEAPKSEASARTISVDGGVMAELQRHKAAQAAMGLQLGIAQTPDWLVFSAPGQPTVPQNPARLGIALRAGWLARRTRK